MPREASPAGQGSRPRLGGTYDSGLKSSAIRKAIRDVEAEIEAIEQPDKRYNHRRLLRQLEMDLAQAERREKEARDAKKLARESAETMTQEDVVAQFRADWEAMPLPMRRLLLDVIAEVEGTARTGTG